MSSGDFVRLHYGGRPSVELEKDYEAMLAQRGDVPLEPPVPLDKPPLHVRPKHPTEVPGAAPMLAQQAEVTSAALRSMYVQEHRSLTAWDRHRRFVHDYLKYYGGSIDDLKAKEKVGLTDYDILKKQHRFVRTAEDNDHRDWEKRMAKKYYDKLFKEYCLADMSRYKEGKVGLRWRTQSEVIAGKGHFICGNKACRKEEGLRSFEVNFAYMEEGKRKQVKVRVCTKCAYKLNYKKIKQMEAEEKRKEKSRKRKSRHEEDTDGESPKHKKHRKHKKQSRTRDVSAGSADAVSSAAEPTEPHERKRKDQRAVRRAAQADGEGREVGPQIRSSSSHPQSPHRPGPLTAQEYAVADLQRQAARTAAQQQRYRQAMLQDAGGHLNSRFASPSVMSSGPGGLRPSQSSKSSQKSSHKSPAGAAPARGAAVDAEDHLFDSLFP